MSKDIILYGTGCPRCVVLKQKLDSKQILYVENTSIEDMKALGIDAVPVLCIDGVLMSFKDAVEWVNAQ